MGLQLVQALHPDLFVGIEYQLAVVHDPYLAAQLEDNLGPLDEENEKRVFEGDMAYFYGEEVMSGSVGHVGSIIGNWPSTGEFFVNVSLFCPFGGMRYAQLDRAPWGSAQVNSAFGNVAVGGNFARYERSVTFIDDPRSGGLHSGPDTNPPPMTADTVGAVSVALNGIKLINDTYKLTQLGFIGDFTEQQANKTRKITLTNLIKAYLDKRNDFEAFAFSFVPRGLISEPNPANPYEALRGIYQATTTDTRVYTPDEVDPDVYTVSGTLTGIYQEFDVVSLGQEIVNFDLSSWSMNANSRVSPGIASSRV